MHCIALTVLISIHISFVIIYYSHICSREISTPPPLGSMRGGGGWGCGTNPPTPLTPHHPP